MNFEYVEQQMKAYQEAIQITDNPLLEWATIYTAAMSKWMKEVASTQLKWQQEMSKIMGVENV